MIDHLLASLTSLAGKNHLALPVVLHVILRIGHGKRQATLVDEGLPELLETLLGEFQADVSQEREMDGVDDHHPIVIIRAVARQELLDSGSSLEKVFYDLFLRILSSHWEPSGRSFERSHP